MDPHQEEHAAMADLTHARHTPVVSDDDTASVGTHGESGQRGLVRNGAKIGLRP
jgi:hypothetical protein